MNKYMILNRYIFDAFYKALRRAEIKKAYKRKLRNLRLESQRKMRLIKESA